jgi:Secretion system C-terminal sorting domain
MKNRILYQQFYHSFLSFCSLFKSNMIKKTALFTYCLIFCGSGKDVFAQSCFPTQTYSTGGTASTFTIPGANTVVYNLQITCDGAKGGISGDGLVFGGLGARMRGTFLVNGGDVLRIVVGNNGSNGAECMIVLGDCSGGGGGGGSAVIRCTGGGTGCTTGTLLIAAGGGGGGGSAPGTGGLITQGTGNGGNGGTHSGGGGGGLNSMGMGLGGSQAIITGLGVSSGGFGPGAGGAGFGGGGAGTSGSLGSGYQEGGGGGGYSGGNAGLIFSSGFGSGGQSYNSSISQLNTPNVAPSGKVILQCLTVLSTELISFKVTQLDKSALLTWQTASESNAKNFDIEKSLEGTSFSKIKEVKANNTPSTYQSFDDNFTESAYYRLKINDLDGKSDYSKIVFVDKGKGQKLQVFPNPVKDKLTILGASKDEFKIIDLLGRVILRGILSDNQMDIDVSKMASGLYLIQTKDTVMKFLKD